MPLSPSDLLHRHAIQGTMLVSTTPFLLHMCAQCYPMDCPHASRCRWPAFLCREEVENFDRIFTKYHLCLPCLQIKTFNEACVMVRQPALELISYLKKADYSKPALRYLLCILSHAPLRSRIFFWNKCTVYDSPWAPTDSSICSVCSCERVPWRCVRRRDRLWEDHVSVPRPAFLLHSRLVASAHTRW